MIQSEQHLSKKNVWSPVCARSRNDCRTSAMMTTEKTLMQTSCVPKLTCYSFKFHVKTQFKEKKQQWATPYPKCWEEHGVNVQHHVVTCWQYTPSVTSLGLKWQYIQNDSLPGLCNIYIRPCLVTSSWISCFLWASKRANQQVVSHYENKSWQNSEFQLKGEDYLACSKSVLGLK